MIIKKTIGENINSEVKLWRYYDIHKFISLITSKSFYFARMDTMEDLNEGISKDQLQFKYGDNFEKQKIKTKRANAISRELALNKRQQKYFVSCWFLHSRESVAMWNLYSTSSGVAIGVNGSDLINHLINKSTFSSDEEKFSYLYHGKVIYKDFFNKSDRHAFKDETGIMGFHKDVCFEHEKEYRFLLKQDLHNYKTDEINGVSLKLKQFSKISIDVVFHPKMQPWQKENIKKLIEIFGLSNIHFRDSEIAIK